MHIDDDGGGGDVLERQTDREREIKLIELFTNILQYNEIEIEQ